MKKVLTTLFAVVLAVACLACAVSAADVSVDLDGKKLDFEQPPVIIEGRTLVPLRAIFEALGASVEWDGATKTVTSVKEDVTIKLTIGSNVLYRNGEGKELDVPAQIVGEGYTMVPARAIAEAYGVTVDWDDATKTVLLTSPVVEEKIEGTIISMANAEKGMGYDFTASGGTLSIVADPVNGSNNVYYIESQAKTNKSWNYLWLVTEFAPGKTYKISYDIMLGKDANGVAIEKSKSSACFQYAQSDKDNGAVKDHGMKMIEVFPDKWSTFEFLYTVPETLIADKGMRFGIYMDPISDCGISMYIDNISVVPADSATIATPVLPAPTGEGFDWSTAKGVLFDFDETVKPFNVVNSTGTVENGLLTIVCESSTDPQFYYTSCNLDASKYSGVAFRFKPQPANPDAKLSAIYFATDSEQALSESKRVNLMFENCAVDAEGFYNGYVDMSANESWKGIVALLRIDPADSIGTYIYDKILIVEK